MIRVPDPAAMTVEELQGELAVIMARGWWRLWLRAKAVDDRRQAEPCCVRAAQAPDSPAPARAGDAR